LGKRVLKPRLTIARRALVEILGEVLMVRTRVYKAMCGVRLFLVITCV
jgi:hypothetical protein